VAGGAPMTADVRRTPRRGTSSRLRARRMHRRTHEKSLLASGRRVLRSVLRPVRVFLILKHGASKAFRGEAFDSVSRLGKPTRVGGTSTGAGSADIARLAACHCSRKGEAWHVRKGRRSRPPSLRGHEELGFGCSHVVFQLQTSVGGIWPRISSAYALPKERSGSSERGPSSERRSAGQTVGRRFE
jgi:hypothetical protein